MKPSKLVAAALVALCFSNIPKANAIPEVEKNCFEQLSALKLNRHGTAPSTPVGKYQKKEGLTYNVAYGPSIMNKVYKLGYSDAQVQAMPQAILKVHSDHVEFKSQILCAEHKPECFETKSKPATPDILRKIININLKEITSRGVPASSMPQLRETLNACRLLEGADKFEITRIEKLVGGAPASQLSRPPVGVGVAR